MCIKRMVREETVGNLNTNANVLRETEVLVICLIVAEPNYIEQLRIHFTVKKRQNAMHHTIQMVYQEIM